MIDSVKWDSLVCAVQKTLDYKDYGSSDPRDWLFNGKRRDYVDSRFFNIPEKPDICVERFDLAAEKYPFPYDSPGNVIYAQVYPVAPREGPKCLEKVYETMLKIILAIDLNRDPLSLTSFCIRPNLPNITYSGFDKKIYFPGTISAYEWIGDISSAIKESKKFIPLRPCVENQVAQYIAPEKAHSSKAYRVLSIAVFPDNEFLREAMKGKDFKVSYQSRNNDLEIPPTL